MNYGIQRLCHLVQIKNDLNRKRRRFYALKTIEREYIGNDANKKPMYVELPTHAAYTVETATAGYNQAQADMKAMTKEMRALRVEMGARFNWSDHGAIDGIFYQGDYIRAGSPFFNRMIDLYNADGILLGD